jgi:hypothetical protein
MDVNLYLSPQGKNTLATWVHAGFLRAYFSTLKMGAICSSETSTDFQRTTWSYIPEDGTFHNHRCENLKSITDYISTQ